MTEKDARNRVFDPPADAETSGVWMSPWIAGLHALEAPAQDGLVAAGARVLERFHAFTREDRDAVLGSALERLAREPGATVARMAHAVFCAAAERDLGRWAARIPAPPGEIARELARAGERASALVGRERSVFFAVCALDDVAFESEARRVALCGAVAYQVRWNTAHQHLSRAWRKICEGGPLAGWCGTFRAGHRFVCGPPSVELWEAARAYLDACATGEGQACGGLQAWGKAHGVHQDWFNEYKRQSSQATQRWREVAESLDASGVRPKAIQRSLVRRCADLGIDRWVVPAKLEQQSWHDLLAKALRPTPEVRDAWRAFLREHGFGPEVHEAFRALERDAALVEVASVKLEHAYKRLLASAEAQPGESVGARDAFRSLVDALTISGGAAPEPRAWGKVIPIRADAPG